MSLSDDPLNNASPTTRQRFENALARRRSRESQFRVVIPPATIQHLEAKAHQAQGGENQAWVQWEYSPEEWAHFDQISPRKLSQGQDDLSATCAPLSQFQRLYRHGHCGYCSLLPVVCGLGKIRILARILMADDIGMYGIRENRDALLHIEQNSLVNKLPLQRCSERVSLRGCETVSLSL